MIAPKALLTLTVSGCVHAVPPSAAATVDRDAAVVWAARAFAAAERHDVPAADQAWAWVRRLDRAGAEAKLAEARGRVAVHDDDGARACVVGLDLATLGPARARSALALWDHLGLDLDLPDADTVDDPCAWFAAIPSSRVLDPSALRLATRCGAR